ncbi:MFS transporter, partial [Lactobacillus crispatus]
ESSNIRQQKNSSSNIFLHNLTVALNLTIQHFEKNKTFLNFFLLFFLHSPILLSVE